MNIVQGDAVELLAAEYVLDWLTPRTRRRFERWILRDPAVAACVERWEGRLARLAWLAPTEPPPARAKRRLQAFLKNERPRRRLGLEISTLWYYLSPLLVAIAAFFIVILSERIGTLERPPQGIAILTGPRGHARWVLTMGHDRMHVVTVGRLPLPPGKSYELWFEPYARRPMIPVVLLPPRGTMDVRFPRAFYVRLSHAHLLAVSLEPAGGSPTGHPTGPVLYTATPHAV